MKPSPLSLARRYRMRDGTAIVCLEHALERALPDLFSWRGWYMAGDKRRYHWYNSYGEWANGRATSVDLVEVK